MEDEFYEFTKIFELKPAKIILSQNASFLRLFEAFKGNFLSCFDFKFTCFCHRPYFSMVKFFYMMSDLFFDYFENNCQKQRLSMVGF